MGAHGRGLAWPGPLWANLGPWLLVLDSFIRWAELQLSGQEVEARSGLDKREIKKNCTSWVCVVRVKLSLFPTLFFIWSSLS